MRGYTIFTIIVVIVSTSQASDLSEKDKFVVLRDGCLKSAGVTNDQIETTRKGTYAQDAAVSSYFKCIFLKLGLISEAGDLNVDVLIQKFPPSADKAKVKAAADACVTQKTHQGDDTAQGLYVCFVEKFGPVSFA